MWPGRLSEHCGDRKEQSTKEDTMSIQTALSTIRNPFAGRRSRTAGLERLDHHERHGLDRAESLRAQSALTLSVR
jgi:hypothetical protein